VKRLIALGLATIAASAAGSPPENLVEEGRRVYNFRCYYCHGYSGDARTLAATMLPTRPRAFSELDTKDMPPTRIALAVRSGIEGTAMKAFGGTLSAREIEAVTAFVHDEFLVRRAANTRYHTPENGWAGHERYSAAFPFADGRIGIDAPPESLGPREQAGRNLFLSTCITCHDRGSARDPGPTWEKDASKPSEQRLSGRAARFRATAISPGGP
jgi:cytochrome c oxidase cbb3-type subunit 3